MTLLQLQRQMADAVMRPLTTRWGMQKKTADGKAVADEAARFIKPNRRLTSFERLEIYNRQYWFRVLSALADDFPGLEAVVGKRQFEKLSRAYLEANPSRSFTLRNLGSKLKSWLRANPEWAGKRHALALDVVRLEWAYVEAFDNGQEPALSLADLTGLGADSCLSLQPHVRLVELDFAVDEFIIDLHRRQAVSSVASNAKSGVGGSARHKRLDSFAPSKTHLAVHRFELLVYYKRLEQEAYHLLQALQNNIPLGDALERTFENSTIPPQEQAARIQQWFSSWAELGWFCRHRKAKPQPRAAEKRA